MELNKDVHDRRKAALPWMVFHLSPSRERVTLGSKHLVVVCFLGCSGQLMLWLTQLMRRRKQVLLMPNLPKFFSLASGFTVASCSPYLLCSCHRWDQLSEHKL